jgi:ATP-dependent RNA helicase SUPV3L1/SUV3
VLALLGPTNTGKTHRAIERMLDFETGMMGLPLRLLAREVYDRVSARVGEEAVALVTGEEKRVPGRPRYWICTVEAMPPGLPVDFLAVDEIQLIGHPERGHVFTDRLLHWRGRSETWFLGSETIAPLLREQLAATHTRVRVDRLPRLSRLRCTGQASLRTLPRRSAVVAFSMQQVYQLADVLRVRRGGAAVVLGALSPRVRNAQVAMYQAGEVDFLVATDAIGMGLNLDIEHIALAAATKFDGRETRQLEVTELAQIVGRAGRYLRDGTFGTLAPLPELQPHVVQQLEAHRFAPERNAYYRNARLDFASLAALAQSLEERPPHSNLRAAPAADDSSILRALGARPEIQSACDTGERVSLLWDLCRIPNYEKQIPEHQAERLLPLFTQLALTGRLSATFLDEQLRKLERYDGDIDVLLARLSAVRTWLYVCHQRGWVEHATTWQERARALEDRLGDLLHERLLQRFVAARVSRRQLRSPTQLAKHERESHHPFAKLAQLSAASSGDVEPERDWLETLIAAPFRAFELRGTGELWHAGERLALLVRGKTPLTPALKPLLPDWLEAGARLRVERRLQAHLKDLGALLLEPLYPEDRAALLHEASSAPLRGVLYQLEQGFGSVARRDVAAQLAALSPADRSVLERWNIQLGHACVFARDLLTSERLRIRAALCAVWQPHEHAALSARIQDQGWAWTAQDNTDRQLCLRLGFVPFSRWVVRCDVLEALLQRFKQLESDTGNHDHRDALKLDYVRQFLGCTELEAANILRALPAVRRSRRRRSKRAAQTARV